MLQKWLVAFGLLFLSFGVLGFINNPIVGVFPVNVAHNILNSLLGILTLAFAFKGPGPAKKFIIALAVLFTTSATLGLIFPNMMRSALAINRADNLLNWFMAILFITLSIWESAKSS